MNANRIISMIIRLFVRKIMSRGIDAGLDYASGRGKKPEDMTKEERKQAQAGKETAKRARQATKLSRRIGRM